MKRLIFFVLMAFTLGASFDKEKGVKTVQLHITMINLMVEKQQVVRFLTIKK